MGAALSNRCCSVNCMRNLPTTLLVAAATATLLTACGSNDSAFTDEQLDDARQVMESFDAADRYAQARDTLMDEGIVVEKTTATNICTMLDDGASPDDIAYTYDALHDPGEMLRIVKVVEQEMCQA